jgi:hypothetical protein
MIKLIKSKRERSFIYIYIHIYKTYPKFCHKNLDCPQDYPYKSASVISWVGVKMVMAFPPGCLKAHIPHSQCYPRPYIFQETMVNKWSNSERLWCLNVAIVELLHFLFSLLPHRHLSQKKQHCHLLYVPAELQWDSNVVTSMEIWQAYGYHPS